MKFSRDEKRGVITMVPSRAEESALLAEIGQLAPGTILKYQGRSGGEDGVPFRLSFLLNERKITLEPTDSDDQLVLGGIRNAIFFGGLGLIFLNYLSEPQAAAQFTVSRCKHCGAALASLGQCEWKTCMACAEKCQHEYKLMFAHAEGLKPKHQFVAECCIHCGTAKPKEEVGAV